MLRLKLDGLRLQDDIVNRALAGTEEETRRMAAIVDRVRRYAKRDIERNARISLRSVVTKAFDHYSRHAAGTSLLTLAAEDDAVIAGNDLEIELLVINLMKNADQAASDTTHDPDPEHAPSPAVRVSLCVTDRTAVLRVVDNGPPLPDRDFERLRTVSESVKEDGLGLGLAIVRNIVDEHGASLHVERLDPRGLAVTVIFPLSTDADPKPSAASATLSTDRQPSASGIGSHDTHC